jgi:hypothetical protein
LQTGHDADLTQTRNRFGDRAGDSTSGAERNAVPCQWQSEVAGRARRIDFVTDFSSTLRVRLQPQRTAPARDPRQAFWQSVLAPASATTSSAGSGSPESSDDEIARLEDRLVNALPVALLAQLREHAQRDSTRARTWSIARFRKRPQVSGLESLRVAIVRYDSLVFDLTFVGPAARGLVNDPSFVAFLTSTLVPTAFASAIPGALERAVWVDVDRGMWVDTSTRHYWPLASLTLVPAILFAAIGFLFFAGATGQRQRLTDQYESLVKSQQTVIETLSNALADCSAGAGDSDESADFKASATSMRGPARGRGSSAAARVYGARPARIP